MPEPCSRVLTYVLVSGVGPRRRRYVGHAHTEPLRRLTIKGGTYELLMDTWTYRRNGRDPNAARLDQPVPIVTEYDMAQPRPLDSSGGFLRKGE